MPCVRHGTKRDDSLTGRKGSGKPIRRYAKAVCDMQGSLFRMVCVCGGLFFEGSVLRVLGRCGRFRCRCPACAGPRTGKRCGARKQPLGGASSGFFRCRSAVRMLVREAVLRCVPRILPDERNTCENASAHLNRWRKRFSFGFDTQAPAYTRKPSPMMNSTNIATFSLSEAFGAPRNSFQMRMPHRADTSVAPCPNP